MLVAQRVSRRRGDRRKNDKLRKREKIKKY